MKKVLLNISCGAALIISSFVATIPAQAAGPNKLLPSKNVSYPTWHAGKNTKFCVQNLNRKNSGKVNISVNFFGKHQEDVKVGSGGTKCIDRAWAGNQILVTNSGKTTVRVWTE
jgi:hypothetical protein